MKLKPSLIAAVVSLLLLGAGLTLNHFFRPYGTTLPRAYYGQQPGTPITRPLQLSHVVIIVEENKPRTSIVGSASAPYLNSLFQTYATATHYYAVTHPSLPNYIALTSGTTAGITNDCNPPSTTCQASVLNITDRLSKAHKAWKAYFEDMPAPCTQHNAGTYAVRHNPFLYYPAIRYDSAACSGHDVSLAQLDADLDHLADYVFIVPNTCNDMHDCSVRTGDNWLASHTPAILHSPAFTTQHSLLVVVWDEGDDDSNEVPIVFAGPAARHSYTSNRYYSHCSLLRTLEDVWHLQPLTDNDRTAPSMTDMLQ